MLVIVVIKVILPGHFVDIAPYISIAANIEFRVPYSQRSLFNAIPDTNHNANPTNPNRNSKGNPNPNTRYRCEYGTLNSMFA